PCVFGNTELVTHSTGSQLFWVQGFSNKNFGFINDQTLCYPCGKYILFLDIKTKKTRVLQCQSGQVGAFAANANSQVLAFSDRKLNPSIYIYTFPELSKPTELKGSDVLDYTLLAFSFTGPYLASYSSVPEFVLSVWNWQENILLCSKPQPGLTATSLSFNPMNWQQLCFVAESAVTIWHIERSKDEHHLTRHPVELPDDCGVVSPHEDFFFPASRCNDPYHGPDLPVSAIAGLKGDEAETFVPRNCIKTSVHPTAHCWTATSEIYMGCKEGYILSIDAEKYSVCVLQKKEGILILYHINDLQYEMKICADISQPISSLIFTPDYTSLLLVTDQATSMACCPSSNSVAVGTQRGQIFFLDVTKAETPRVVHEIFLSKLPVLSLHNNFHWCSLPASVLADEMLHLSVISDLKNDLVEVMVLLNVAEVQRARLEIFHLSSAILTGMFDTSALKKEQYDLDYPLSSAVRLKDKIVYGYCTCAPFICKYHLSEEIPSNQFGSGLLCLSPNSQWLAAAAKDGVLFIYNTSTLDILAQRHCHSYQGGGIRSMVFSLDGNFILVNSENDCALVCLKWKKYCPLLFLLFLPIRQLKAQVIKIIFFDIKFYSFKNSVFFVHIQITFYSLYLLFKKQVQKMMYDNEQVPDIEKLEHWEFNLDVEEQEQVQAEAEQEVAMIEMESLSYCYLQDLIKYECWDVMSVKGRAVKCFHMDCEVSNYPLKERSEEELETVKEAQEENLEDDSEAVLSEEEDEKKAAEEVVDDGAFHYLNGSLSSQYGGDTSTLYHQRDLHTREQKLNQIILLKDIIYEVKTAFNEEFNVVVQQKEQEIARVKERNEKIREILAQLDHQVEVWEPVLTDDEMPERALTVQDSEVTEKCIFLFHPLKSCSLILLISRHCDNDRLRALDDMMGGVLEIRREDILKMDIPPPSFTSRPEDLWTEEEKKTFEEYEQKAKELNEQKEEYRESQMAIYQEELKILNLTYALLLDEELDNRGAGLHKFLTKKKKEKNLEHGFMKEFADIPHGLLDELLQLYSHRPETPGTETLHDTANPYVRGSPEDYQEALSLLMKAMDELDSPENMPSGLHQSVWKRFCVARRNKMESEELVKWKALALADMQAFLRRRMDENEKMKSELESIFQELNWLKEEKMKLQQNVFVQLLLEQGQVELGSTEIPEYNDAILIHRTIAEELNSTLAEGEKKITAMIEFQDFSKGIIQLEWEHKKMKMQIQDLREKARDIVILPISKDCQLFLTVQNYDTHIAQQLAGMEESLAVMDKLHKKNVKNHQKKVRELKKYIRLKEQENYELSLQLKEMLISVSERMHIFEAAGESREALQGTSKKCSESNSKRYQEILKQKFLRNLLREQKKQLAILQSEAEGLKPRTHIV
uniref:Cilia- and flagella-associated protein 43 n=1 Tax=Malurus cyaneus samueli TaxID=2593467 RepID=A0A8C5TEA9_9PASS